MRQAHEKWFDLVKYHLLFYLFFLLQKVVVYCQTNIYNATMEVLKNNTKQCFNK